MESGLVERLRSDLELSVPLSFDVVHRQVDGTLLVGYSPNGEDFHLYVRQGDFHFVTYYDHGVAFCEIDLGSSEGRSDVREFINEGYLIVELCDYAYVKDLIDRGIRVQFCDSGVGSSLEELEKLEFCGIDTSVYYGFVG